MKTLREARQAGYKEGRKSAVSEIKKVTREMEDALRKAQEHIADLEATLGDQRPEKARGIHAMAKLLVYREWQQEVRDKDSDDVYALMSLTDITTPANNAAGYFAHRLNLVSTDEVWDRLQPDIKRVASGHRKNWMKKFNDVE
ncbi:MAG: hypothetical protein DRQ40_05330 [Gammaproteobacteria bacterium]|nr:MAG: hypothetical protein DRQ40_05330 [Gammaproteobacteria bacterium]